MSSIACVIPIFPPHYHFIYNLVRRGFTKTIDLFLIFSNQKEFELFEFKNDIKPIIMPPDFKTENIVSYKKFYALEHHLMDTEYDYFVVCDSEIEFVTENFNKEFIYQKIDELYRNKKIYAGLSNGTRQITDGSASLFCKEDYDKLRHITKNFVFYYWWSDIPIYRRDTLKDFFSKIDYSNINWFCFDHMVYLNYLMLYKDFYIVNISKELGHGFSLETFSTKDVNLINKLSNLGYGFGFIKHTFFFKNIKLLIDKGAIFLYHLDRR